MEAMNCENIQEHFSAYREEALAPRLRAAISQHLDACTGCKHAYSGFVRVCDELGRLEDVPVPDNLALYVGARLNVHLLQSRYDKPVDWLRWLRNVVATGAVTAALVLGLAYGVRGPWRPAGLGGGNPAPPPGVLGVGTPELYWSGSVPAIRLDAKVNGRVEVTVQEGNDSPRDLERIPVHATQLVRMRLTGLGQAAETPYVVRVHSVSRWSENWTSIVLPAGGNPERVVEGSGFEALQAVADHYRTPIVVQGALPGGDLKIDCGYPSAKDALAHAPTLAGWKPSDVNGAVTIQTR